MKGKYSTSDSGLLGGFYKGTFTKRLLQRGFRKDAFTKGPLRKGLLHKEHHERFGQPVWFYIEELSKTIDSVEWQVAVASTSGEENVWEEKFKLDRAIQAYAEANGLPIAQ